MNRVPKEIRRLGPTGLSITWSDGVQQQIDAETLRRQCPCAGCREARGDGSHEQPLTPKRRSLTIIQNSREEETRLDRVWAVGNYAIGIAWGDGHQTGIYTFEHLQALATIASTASPAAVSPQTLMDMKEDGG